MTDDMMLEIRGIRSDVKGDVGNIHKRIDELARTTGEFEKVAIEQLAILKQIETTCPISDVVEDLEAVKGTLRETRGERRSVAWIISTGLVIAGLIIGMATLHGGG